MKKLLMFAVSFLFVAVLSTTAKATTLPPAVGVGDALVVDLNGGNPTSFIGQVGGNPVFTGDLYQSVYINSTGLLFEYQFTNTTTAPLKDNIDILTAFDFTGYITALGNSEVAPGVAPNVDYNGGNGDVNYVFTNGVTPGQSSDVLWVQTNATLTAPGVTLLQDHGQAQVNTYGPISSRSTPTPEPATMAMFGMGTLGLFGLRKRKIA